MKLPEKIWEQVKMLPIGTTKRVQHCGKAGGRELSIKATPEGWTAHCFKCGESWKRPRAVVQVQSAPAVKPCAVKPSAEFVAYTELTQAEFRAYAETIKEHHLTEVLSWCQFLRGTPIVLLFGDLLHPSWTTPTTKKPYVIHSKSEPEMLYYATSSITTAKAHALLDLNCVYIHPVNTHSSTGCCMDLLALGLKLKLSLTLPYRFRLEYENLEAWASTMGKL